MAAVQSGSAPALDLVRHLITVADCDTVYRDLYLGRAGALLAPTLSRQQYRDARSTDQAVAAALAESRAAALRLDWARVEEHAQRAEQLRSAAAARAGAIELGERVYDAPPTAIDPFSPGLGELAAADPRELRTAAVTALTALERGDAEHAKLYAARRAFLEALSVTGRVVVSQRAEAQTMETADIEQRALEAAERGDTAALAGYARELRARQEQAAAAPQAPSAAPVAAASAASRAAMQCPVDLAAALPTGTAERAAALGLGAVRSAPVDASQPLFDYIAAHIAQARPADADAQREGAARVEKVSAEMGWPSDLSAAVRELVEQFLRQVFVNSGGGRYVPPFTAESILVEDFPEDAAPPASGPLLTALGLPHRCGLSRLEIERALLERGAAVVRDQLGLDPTEFRLVCVPQDIYTRVGRERGWGQQPQWTHFDGYQVIKGGGLRALVGGDVRYGGLNDLVSIAIHDQRDGVLARFAVIRRARQVARWR